MNCNHPFAMGTRKDTMWHEYYKCCLCYRIIRFHKKSNYKAVKKK